ncbi:hypothetical protein BDP55DRAFT_364645 [Colletotrichum godetiae]|uniref:Uncharacterized protein n=1 Tax=Colletotrichum godetiae TaxID=1209918 RepID=A0AAJ0EQ57_9PEZI|nr:uncharacterized protein BDP55DRAFT_364645 [Colletotrichum godetiae]KAK1659252.1 hypothetical protein BDP55DRAFT_364645 [Colletotrichum godetiae]
MMGQASREPAPRTDGYLAGASPRRGCDQGRQWECQSEVCAVKFAPPCDTGWELCKRVRRAVAFDTKREQVKLKSDQEENDSGHKPLLHPRLCFTSSSKHRLTAYGTQPTTRGTLAWVTCRSSKTTREQLEKSGVVAEGDAWGSQVKHPISSAVAGGRPDVRQESGSGACKAASYAGYSGSIVIRPSWRRPMRAAFATRPAPIKRQVPRHEPLFCGDGGVALCGVESSQLSRRCNPLCPFNYLPTN